MEAPTKILMCEPTFYNIYEINPWMNKNIQANTELSKTQWQQLKQAILACGAEIELVEPVNGLPDLVFTANAALLLDQQVLLANFKCPERQGERIYYQAWFEQHGYSIIKDTTRIPFEGAGDALFAGNTLFLASGFRTDAKVRDHIAALSGCKIVECSLVDSYFYHLDTCFCPINASQAIWWPGAFDKASQSRMQQHIELFAIPEAEAKHFACNAVVINKNVIIPSGCPETRALLERLGYRVYDVPMTEYIKAGGACKCLTLKLNHFKP